MENCPACGSEIELHRSFMAGEYDWATNFVYECEHCLTKLNIEVESEPVFIITLNGG